MKTKEIKKNVAIQAIIKMISVKEDVRSYAKGNISFEELTKKGIKLAKPL